MIKLKEVKAQLTNGQIKTVIFGHPNTEQEKDAMFRFRLKAYLKKNYIKVNHYKDGRDYDEYDKDKKSVYFIAKVDDKIIGSARLIFDDPLPTRKECFIFEDPEKIKKIHPDNRAELGRLIAIKYNKNKYFQKHLIMLSLFEVITNYCKKNNIEGGYSFIKNKLKEKFEKISFPVHTIENAKQIYTGKTLHNYFQDKNDKVWPIYFLTQEIQQYLTKTKDENRSNSSNKYNNN